MSDFTEEQKKTLRDKATEIDSDFRQVIRNQNREIRKGCFRVLWLCIAFAAAGAIITYLLMK